MVSHFQKLFDVTSLSGVYPRMNEVYTRLGEMTNAMRNLRDVLDLGNDSSSGKKQSTFTKAQWLSQLLWISRFEKLETLFAPLNFHVFDKYIILYDEINTFTLVL